MGMGNFLNKAVGFISRHKGSIIAVVGGIAAIATPIVLSAANVLPAGDMSFLAGAAGGYVGTSAIGLGTLKVIIDEKCK